jgi:uncharacterized glyoxalase superfamily protein PhnB
MFLQARRIATASFAPAFTPAVFYRDPLAAMAWLERAFGFEVAMRVTDAEGNLGDAEMAFRGAVVSIGGEWEGPPLGGARFVSPASLDGAGTQTVWVSVTGIDAHGERARLAGAKITQEPEDQFYGSRSYRAHDREGHVWNFSEAITQPSQQEMSKSGWSVETPPLQHEGKGESS